VVTVAAEADITVIGMSDPTMISASRRAISLDLSFMSFLLLLQ
jgi:hypothetical protein